MSDVLKNNLPFYESSGEWHPYSFNYLEYIADHISSKMNL
jgi:hypothetical protein